MYTRTATICHGTKRVPSPALVEKGRTHVAMMSANPAFTDPRPTLQEVAAACDALEAASQVYEFNKGRLDLVARNAAHARLRLLIISLAAYVQATCGSDASTIRSAGFAIKRKRGPSAPVTAPDDMRARRSILPGGIDLRWGGVKGKKLYAVYINQGDPGRPEDWSKLLQTTKNYCTVTELVTDKPYTFRVAALGVLGEGPVSDIATAKAA